MVSVSSTLARRMRHALLRVAAAEARSSGYCQRESKFSAPVFCSTLVLGWLQHPDASVADLAQGAAVHGVRISPQGLQQRFTEGAARLLLAVLHSVLEETEPGAQSCPLPLLERYTQVVVEDSSVVSLPEELHTVWRGCGGRTAGQAALKLQVQLDLRRGQIHGPWLTAGRQADRASPGTARSVPCGSLRLADLGYFALNRLAAEHRAGCFWVTRLHPQVGVHLADGMVRRGEDLAAFLAQGPAGPQEMLVALGVRHRIPCRLLAIPRPPEVVARHREHLRRHGRHKHQNASPQTLALAAWELYVTNDLALTRADILALYRSRWQIEILWRLWKAEGRLTHWRTQNPWRILCEIYAKLVGLVLIQRLLARGAWQCPQRSLVHGSRMIRDHAVAMAHALRAPWRLRRLLATLLGTLPSSAPVSSHRTRPATYRRLRDPAAFP